MKILFFMLLKIALRRSPIKDVEILEEYLGKDLVGKVINHRLIILQNKKLTALLKYMPMTLSQLQAVRV